MPAPIAFFAFNRPEHTRRALEALRGNPLARETTIYAFCDGPRADESDGGHRAISEVRRAIEEVSWSKQLVLRFRDANAGLLSSLLSGIGEVVAEHDEVIVVEDDMLPSPGFLEYLNEALSLYRGHEEVMHVSAYSPLWEVPPWYEETTFFFNHTYVGWGWATWKRAWDRLSTDGHDLRRRLDGAVPRSYANIDDTYEIYWALKHLDNGNSQDWNCYWNASIMASGGFCLHPVASLADNIGFDGSGTQCAAGEESMLRPVVERLEIRPIPVREDPRLRRLITRRPFLEKCKFRAMHLARTVRHHRLLASDPSPRRGD